MNLKKLLLSVFFIWTLNINFLQASPQILHRGNAVEPSTLDLHKASDFNSCAIIRDLFESLVVLDEQGGIIPGAAEKWEISPDGKIYDFYIRANAKWSNGDPLTAHDFVYSWRRLIDPKTACPYANHLYVVQNAEDIIKGQKQTTELGVEALNDNIFRVKLNAPATHFLSLLVHTAFGPIHQKALEKDPKNFTKPNNLVSNGAFKLKKWEPNDILVIEKNPSYWMAEKVRLDEVYFHPMGSETELKAYRAGQIDITSSISDDRLTFVRNDEVLSKELKVPPFFATCHLGLNLTQAPLKDNLKLRQALSLATDRELLTNKILHGKEEPNYTWVYPHAQNNKPAYLFFKDMPKEERLKLARKLYEEVGYSKENPLKIEIRYNTDESRKKLITAIANMWKENLGVQVTLTNTEWKVFLQDRHEKKVTQVFLGRLIGLYNDPHTFAECMTSKSGMNDTGFDNPRYDELVKLAAHEIDPIKRQNYHHEAEKILLDTHAIIPLYNYTSPQLVKAYVKGYNPNIMGHIYSKNIWLEK